MWEDVLNNHLLERVTSEAHHYGVTVQEEVSTCTLDEKLPIESQVTRWMDADATPRCAIESAIQQLRHLVIPEDGVNKEEGERDGRSKFVGAEWWVQRRPINNSLDFHFDIDSCLLHSQKAIRSPDISSIFYLSTSGGPTVVLDQRCAEGWLWGHRLSPTNATCADLIFPRPNQFAIFAGACLHGVMPDIRSGTSSGDTSRRCHEESTEKSADASDSGKKPSQRQRQEEEEDEGLRLTLLVNWWWDKKPLEPCCAPVTDAWASRLNSVHPPSSTSKTPFPSSPSPSHQLSPLLDLNLQTSSTPVLAVEGYISLAGSASPYDFFIPDEASSTWQERVNTRVRELDHVRRIHTALHA